MIDEGYRQRHWRASLGVMGLTVTLALLPLFLTAFFAEPLNGLRFLGSPFGFYLAAQGGGLLMLGGVFWFVRRQGVIDRRHGASEEI